MITKSQLSERVKELATRVQQLEQQLKYDVQPSLRLELNTGGVALTRGPMGYTYGPQMHELPLKSAIYHIASHLGLEFKYVAGTPATAVLNTKEAKP
jgi:hypothetical protein